MLGIDAVPPCVTRRIGGGRGTVQLWIEDAITEDKRRKEGLEPDQAVAWRRQEQTMRLFDALIYNFDRNQGNMLITTWDGWKLWFIDHTRSFARVDKPDKEMIERIHWCERGVWERLRALDRAAVDERLGELVARQRRSALFKRRDVLVRYLEERIERIGEGAVLWDAAPPLRAGRRSAPSPVKLTARGDQPTSAASLPSSASSR